MAEESSTLYIVTGGTGSIGKEIALALAQEGKAVALACRNMQKAQVAIQEIIQKTRNEKIEAQELHLNDIKSVKAYAKSMLERKCKIVLINNAGVMTKESHITTDGYEEDYEVNYLSTVLLTRFLKPQLSKVVFTVSVTRKWSSLPAEFPDERHFSQLGTYARSKRALTMYALHLAEEWKEAGIVVNCADPGVVDSEMIRMGRWFDPLADLLFRPLISTPSRGATSALNALNATQSGLCYHHEKSVPLYKGMGRMKGYNKVIEIVENMPKSL